MRCTYGDCDRAAGANASCEEHNDRWRDRFRAERIEKLAAGLFVRTMYPPDPDKPEERQRLIASMFETAELFEVEAERRRKAT